MKKLFDNCIYRIKKTGSICDSFIHNCTMTYSDDFIALICLHDNKKNT